jgi:hypothetical protein
MVLPQVNELSPSGDGLASRFKGLASKFKGGTRMRRMQRIRRIVPRADSFPGAPQRMPFFWFFSEYREME